MRTLKGRNNGRVVSTPATTDAALPAACTPPAPFSALAWQGSEER